MQHFLKGLLALTVPLCLLSPPMRAAAKPDPALAGEHVIAIVPMIGSGTPADPKRPMFFPTAQEMLQAVSQGHAPQFLSTRFVLADDGQRAIVEFVAPNRQSLRPLLDAVAAGTIVAFEPHKISLEDLNTALQQVKSTFNLGLLRGVPLTPTTTTGAAQ